MNDDSVGNERPIVVRVVVSSFLAWQNVTGFGIKSRSMDISDTELFAKSPCVRISPYLSLIAFLTIKRVMMTIA